MTSEAPLETERAGRPVTIKALLAAGIQEGVVKSIEDFTCFDCPAFSACPYAFDLYNTNGDCMAEK